MRSSLELIVMQMGFGLINKGTKNAKNILGKKRSRPNTNRTIFDCKSPQRHEENNISPNIDAVPTKIPLLFQIFSNKEFGISQFSNISKKWCIFKQIDLNEQKTGNKCQQLSGLNIWQT